jgi:thymidylate synthase (FAD)
MSAITPEMLLHEFDGNVNAGFAVIDSPVHHSPGGVLYLVKPGVVLLSRPSVNPGGLAGFLSGFDESLHFPEYLDDPTALPDGDQLCKIAEQADRYFNNLKSSGHGSGFEHANFSMLLYGVSRSVTHEIVHHRVLSVDNPWQNIPQCGL